MRFSPRYQALLGNAVQETPASLQSESWSSPRYQALLGNAVQEAPASLQSESWSFPIAVPKLELGN